MVRSIKMIIYPVTRIVQPIVVPHHYQNYFWSTSYGTYIVNSSYSSRKDDGKEYFSLTEVLRLLKFGKNVPYFENLGSCWTSSHTLVPKNRQIGSYKDGIFSPGKEEKVFSVKKDDEKYLIRIRHVSRSIGGHPSYVRYLAFDYDILKKKFMGLMRFII